MNQVPTPLIWRLQRTNLMGHKSWAYVGDFETHERPDIHMKHCLTTCFCPSISGICCAELEGGGTWISVPSRTPGTSLPCDLTDMTWSYAYRICNSISQWNSCDTYGRGLETTILRKVELKEKRHLTTVYLNINALVKDYNNIFTAELE
jgi:hypothetical protein